MPPTPYEKAKSGWPSAWLTWILTVQQKIKMIALILKTMESCPSHCETSATRQSLRKLRPERIRKGSAPAGFASKPLRNCNFKNLETLLLEPLKTMESCPSHCETSATRQSETSATRQSLRKLRRERIRKGRAPAGFVPKPLRNRSRKNAETSLLEPTKNKQKTKKKQRNSALATRTSHCETAAGKMPKRRFWNPLKRKKECPNHAKPQPENCRNVAFGTY